MTGDMRQTVGELLWELGIRDVADPQALIWDALKKAEKWDELQGNFWEEHYGRPLNELTVIPLEKRRHYDETILKLTEKLEAVRDWCEGAINEVECGTPDLNSMTDMAQTILSILEAPP